jgi:hypothetical protein
MSRAAQSFQSLSWRARGGIRTPDPQIRSLKLDNRNQQGYLGRQMAFQLGTILGSDGKTSGLNRFLLHNQSTPPVAAALRERE